MIRFPRDFEILEGTNAGFWGTRLSQQNTGSNVCVGIAVEYEGRLFDLKSISPVIARKLFGRPLGIMRDFLVLTSILKKNDKTSEEAVAETLDIMLDGSEVINNIILQGIANGLQSLGIRAVIANNSLLIEDKEKFEEILDAVYEATVEVLKMTSEPKTRLEALQAYASLTECAKKVISLY